MCYVKSEMNFTFLCLVISQLVFLQGINAVYNKDVTCVIDKDEEPMCYISPRASRRIASKPLPSHDPYIPRKNAVLLNCSVECNITYWDSITELISPNYNLKTCFNQSDNYQCESIRYHYLKNVDKVLFLSRTIPNKTFYIVDCLVYAGGERVCHKKDNSGDTYANLVDTGTLARPKEESILAQDEFICEESNDKEVKCDLNPYIPFEDGLRLKDSIKFGDTVLLKSGTYIIILTRECIGSWCGYSGKVTPTRRQSMYVPPGGSVYRCFYAKSQQICKLWYTKTQRELYNQRGWISSR